MNTAQPKLYLNMIVGDFENPDIVERSINSVKDYVDGAFVTITYKDKKPSKSHALVKRLEKLGVTISYYKWTYEFDKARQYALEQVPKGEDSFIYWHDADDVLQNAEKLPEIMQKISKQRIDAVYMEYLYQVEMDAAGNITNVLVTHKRERIIKNNGNWQWRGALHETLIEDREYAGKKIYLDDCKVVHLSPPDRIDTTINRNIEILEKTIVKEKGKDPRTRIHLAKAYYDKGKMVEDPKEQDQYFDKALKFFHLYLEGKGNVGDPDYLEPSGWRQERATALALVGEIATLQKNYDVAISVYDRAIDEGYEFPDYYVAKAMCYTYLGDYDRAEHWLKLGLSMDIPNTTIITTPKQLKERSLHVGSNIAIHKSQFEKAEKMLTELYELVPTEGTKQKLERIKEVKVFNHACQSVVFLGKYLDNLGAKDELVHLVKAIPKEMHQERFASEMRHLYLPKQEWGSKDITIMCGPGVGEWSPKSIEGGIGGSEEAVIYLSQELTKLGWKVTVYANPGIDAGDHDGVTYLPWYDFNTKDDYNILILWRNIGFVDVGINAKYTMVWLHDIPNNPDFTEERVNKVDKIAVLSEYHKSVLKMQKEDGSFVDMPEAKVFITTNGIPDLHVNKWEGNPHHMIYMSSPDRGLVYLLTNWSKIREKVPDAQLNIYYGFDTFDVVNRGNPERMKWKGKMMELMKQDGIVYHGKVGHKELHEAIAKAGVWSYPSDFCETNCISAIKAQALGAVPVTMTLGALDETVKNGIKLDANIRQPAVRNEYVEALTKMLLDEKEQQEIRKQMMPWARDKYHWSTVANTWDTLFKVSLSSKIKGGDTNA